MTTPITTPTQTAPIFRTITVEASLDRAFRVFTEGFDTWWPRSHHIGTSPMKKAIIECHAGGRCYTEQEDGTDCPWGSVLVWEPPHRFVMAWKIGGEWRYEADLSKSSEVEITFTPLGEGATRVDLEHRHFERLGPAGEQMRAAVGGPTGWGGILQLFKTEVDRA